jgi:hypothetical protein
MFGFNRKYDTNAVADAITALIHEDKQRLQFTPDYHIVGARKGNLVFIHDDMMKLEPNHGVVVKDSLSGFFPFGYGYTSRRLNFVKKDLVLKSFPIALEIRDCSELPMHMANKYRIRGEIYAVRPQGIISLDTHRQNGVQFQRIRVNINVGWKNLRRRHWFDASGNEKFETSLDKEEMCTVECWMYLGREDYWKDQLESGFFDFKAIDIVEEDRLWLKEYYQYNRR